MTSRRALRRLALACAMTAALTATTPASAAIEVRDTSWTGTTFRGYWGAWNTDETGWGYTVAFPFTPSAHAAVSRFELDLALWGDHVPDLTTASDVVFTLTWAWETGEPNGWDVLARATLTAAQVVASPPGSVLPDETHHVTVTFPKPGAVRAGAKFAIIMSVADGPVATSYGVPTVPNTPGATFWAGRTWHGQYAGGNLHEDLGTTPVFADYLTTHQTRIAAKPYMGVGTQPVVNGYSATLYSTDGSDQVFSGEPLTFYTSRGHVACRAVTDDSGVATCTGPFPGVDGYLARFRGDTFLIGSTGRAPLSG